jgi:etoposide-induced 2.4 mRNA
MHSHPGPVDPYNPLPSRAHSQAIQHPSPFIPIRLPIFAPVIWLNDCIIRVLSVGGGRPSKDKYPVSRNRPLSTAGFESVEEGESIELRAVGAPKSRMSGGYLQGSRRKGD